MNHFDDFSTFLFSDMIMPCTHVQLFSTCQHMITLRPLALVQIFNVGTWVILHLGPLGFVILTRGVYLSNILVKVPTGHYTPFFPFVANGNEIRE